MPTAPTTSASEQSAAPKATADRAPTPTSGRTGFDAAVRHSRPARVALAGVSGAGRTRTALLIAQGLGGPIAVIDTERGKAAQYADEIPFDHKKLNDFDPELRLLPALVDAATGAYPVLVVDCYSLFWSGPGGLLDRVDREADARTGSTSPGWRANRPMDRRVTAALLSYPGHLVITLRSKTDYIIAPDSSGVHRVRRYALQPEQRSGIEYDFDLVLTMGEDHRATIDKSTIDDLGFGLIIDNPGPQIGVSVRAWANTGTPAPHGFDLLARANDPAATIDDLRAVWTAAADAHLLDMAAAYTGPKREVATLAELIVQRQSEARRRAVSATTATSTPPPPSTHANADHPTTRAHKEKAPHKPQTTTSKAATSGNTPADIPKEPLPSGKAEALAALHALALSRWDDLATIRAVIAGATKQELLDEVVPGQDGEGHVLGQLLAEQLARLTSPPA